MKMKMKKNIKQTFFHRFLKLFLKLKQILSFIQFFSLISDLRLKIYPGILIGGQVWLRPMFPDDRLTLKDCFTDASNMQYFAKGKVWSTLEIEKSFISSSYKNLTDFHVSSWSIISRDGFTGCFWLARKNAETKENQETAEIGYCLRPGLSGKGFTSEAGKIVLDSVSPEFNGVFFATVHPKNKGSQRVLEKMGLKPDKTRQNVFIEKYNAPRHYYELRKSYPRRIYRT